MAIVNDATEQLGDSLDQNTFANDSVISSSVGSPHTRFPNLAINHKLLELRALLINLCTTTDLNTAVVDHITTELGTPLESLVNEYNPVTGIKYDASFRLPQEFTDLRDYTGKPGVYLYQADDGSQYAGSTNNHFRRHFVEHKNNAFTATHKHPLFYSHVTRHG